MISENLALLVKLFWRPQAAIGGIVDRGSLLFASVAVLAVSLMAGHGMRSPFYVPLLVLAGIYVPGTLVLAGLIARVGGIAVIFERDYSTLVTCAAMGWAAVNLPLIAASWLLPLPALGVLAAAAYLYFAYLVFLSLRIVSGASTGAAVAVVSLSWIPLAIAVFFWGVIAGVLRWLASPFFLLYIFYFLGRDFSRVGEGLRRRQSFRRMLDAAAVNPHDGEAQYQLGLIYQRRRQYQEAVERFNRAVAIDPGWTDAHFQLGRMAREQGRLPDALGHFQKVIDQDDKHSQSEILRELGLLYLTAGQPQDAKNELDIYVERRPYDPQGLFYWGQALEGLGHMEAARRAYARTMEAARTAPPYLRRQEAKWSRLAQKQMRKLPVETAQAAD